MPQIEIAVANKSLGNASYPQIKLAKDERARVAILEAKPTFEYVHTIRAPKIDGQGQVVMVPQKKRGSDVEELVIDFEFIGRCLCNGNYSVVAQKQLDPEGCIVCRAASESEAINPPERRFAVHIFRYQTLPNAFQVGEPFSGTVTSWRFGDNIFDSLIEKSGEYGDLRQRDLLLGPCTVEKYQKFDIQVGDGNAQWLLTPQRQQFVGTMYQQAACPDLGALLGRKQNPEFIRADIEKAKRQYAIAYGAPASAATPEQLDQLTGQQMAPAAPSAPAPDAPPVVPVAGLEDILGGLTAPAPAAPTPAIQDILTPAAQATPPVQDTPPAPVQDTVPPPQLVEQMVPAPAPQPAAPPVPDLSGLSNVTIAAPQAPAAIAPVEQPAPAAPAPLELPATPPVEQAPAGESLDFGALDKLLNPGS